MCTTFLYIHTTHKLFREESPLWCQKLFDRLKTVPAFGWRCLRLSNCMQRWAQNLCGADVVLNEVYLHKRGVILHKMTYLNIFIYSLAQPCGYLRLSVLAAAFYLCGCSVDRTYCFWCSLHSFCGAESQPIAVWIWPFEFWCIKHCLYKAGAIFAVLKRELYSLQSHWGVNNIEICWMIFFKQDISM